MRKSILLLFLLGSVFFMFMSCTKKQKEDGIVELKIMIPWVNEELDGFLPVMEAFELQNPNIKLSYQIAKPEDVSSILSTQFQSKKTPADVIDISWAWYIREQAKRGHILSLDDTFKKNMFVKGGFDEVSIDISIYGVPGVGGITVPEYRTSYFKAKNIANPSSFSTLKDMLDTIRFATGNKNVIASGGGVGWTFTSILETFILTYGGRDMHTNLRTGALSWNSKKVKNLIANNLLPLIQEEYFGEPDEYESQLKAMWTGKYALFIGDSTDSQIVNPSIERGVFLFPGQDTVMLWNDFWFIPKYTKHPDEAKKLIFFLATHGQEIQVANGGRIGTYLGIDKNVYPKSEKPIFDLLSSVNVVPDLDDSIGGKFQTIIWDQLSLLWAQPDIKTLDTILENLENTSKESLNK